MDITPAEIKALRTDFYSDFRKGYDEAPVFYPMLSSTVPSSSKQNDYGWMAQLPGMRQWLGERVVNNLVTHNYALLNKTWENTLGVQREDIEDDNLGVYSTVFEEQGRAARKHPDQLHSDLLKTGHSELCFDGQNFFDTDHPVALKNSGLGTYSNYTASGMDLTSDNIITVRSTMAAYKGDGDRTLNVQPRLCVIPPALLGKALAVFQKEFSANGASNVTFQMMDILEVPELSGDDTTFYVADVSRPIRPLIHQARRPLAFQAKNRVDDDVVLEENQVRFYADARYNAGYGLPFLAYKAVN